MSGLFPNSILTGIFDSPLLGGVIFILSIARLLIEVVRYKKRFAIFNKIFRRHQKIHQIGLILSVVYIMDYLI